MDVSNSPPVTTQMPPPLTLVTGAAGCGKTHWTRQRFAAAAGYALVVVPSAAQGDTLAAGIAAETGGVTDEFRPSFHTFSSLVSAILLETSDDGYQVIGRVFQRLVLGDLFRRTTRRDDYFGKMLDAPGFVSALTERVREWKRAGITPELLDRGAAGAAASLDDPMFERKTAELVRLFRAYEQFLAANRLRDEDDCMRLAIAQIERLAPLPNHARVVIVDGFYRFTRLQRLLIAALARRGSAVGEPEIAVAVTLPYAADRPLLFAAPERTLQTLRREFAAHEIVLPARASERDTTLALLESGLFAPSLQRLSPENDENAGFQPSISNREKGALQIFDAPNPYVEAEMTAREFRRLHERGSADWNDFAIVLRTQGDYAPILSAVFERYGIPLGVDGPEILTENPLIKTLLYLLAIVRDGWQRDEVLAFAKSSYTAPDKIAADGLRRRAHAAGVRAGREAWLKLVQDDESDCGVILREAALFEDALGHERAAPMHFAEWVQEAAGQFGLMDRVLSGEPLRAERDRAAWKTAMDVLQAVTQMAALTERGRVSFAEFHAELLAAWQQSSSLAVPEGERVRVVEPYESRERPIRFAAVMGLTERVFPRRIMEDPFLRDAERAALRRSAGIDLEEERGRADDERLFFYLAATAPSERLILSYPRSTDEADTLPSFYLDEVRNVFEGSGNRTQGTETNAASVSCSLFPNPCMTVSRTLADVAPQPEEVVSQADKLLAACADLFDPGFAANAGERDRRVRQAVGLMQECLADDERAEIARSVVASRCLPRLPQLENPFLRADFAGSKAVYSVSELEAYTRCPFQYLLHHVLRLQPDGGDANPKAQGTLLHSVLRRYFRRRKRQNPPAPPDAETMRGELRDLLRETLERKPIDASPHRLRIMERTLADALDGFAEREARFAPLFGMTPAHFELAFGTGIGGAALMEDDERDAETAAPREDGKIPRLHDPISSAEPLILNVTDGGDPVRVCGTIDRVDFDPAGSKALIMDYKLGGSPEYRAIQQGKSLQMPLYLLAMERVFGTTGAVACYDSMRESGRFRILRTEHVHLRQYQPIIPLENGETVKPLNRDQFKELTDNAEAVAVRAARSIAAGSVAPNPGDHCKACAYGDVCRTTAVGHDGES